MADTHEADCPDLTAADAVRELFAQLPGKDIVWLADQVIAVAQHLESVALECVRDGGERTIVCRTDSAQRVIPGRDAPRLFRPLLARFAVLGADETGTDPQLYGGRFALVRSSRTGSVRLEVTFANTPGDQHVTITRTLMAAPQPAAPDSGVADAAPQPSA